MTRLLVFEPSFRRIEAALGAHGDRMEPVVVDEAGQASLRGRKIEPADAAPEIVWFSGDLYRHRATPAFVAATMASPDLKWLQSAAAGFDNPFFAGLAAKGVRVTTSHGQAVGMADFVLAGVLDCFQRGPERRAAQARAEWMHYPFREILDSTWLIVGFGAVGQGVATRAKAFGARVIGVRRDRVAHHAADLISSPDRLTDHLPEADVVVLCAPLNAATRHLADATFFAAMKPRSVLVNVGRGALVDEAALLKALDRGAPAHAVLDVFEKEPLPPDSPLWRNPRVSISPHASGVTGSQDGRNQALFLDNLDRYLSDRPLLHEVVPSDLAAGR